MATNEVIPLFGGHKPHLAPTDLNQEFDSLWKITQALAEAKHRLEPPLRKALDRIRVLERELTEKQAKLEKLDNDLKLSCKHGEENRELNQHLQNQQNKSTALETYAQQLQSALQEERQRVHSLAHTEVQNRELLNTLAQYRTWRDTMVENDRKMRAFIPAVQQHARRQLSEQCAQFEREKSRLETKLADLQREMAQRLETQARTFATDQKRFAAAEKELQRTRQEIASSQLALKTTTDALLNYQIQWSSIIGSNRELKAQAARLQEELSYLRALDETIGTAEERALIAKQNSELRAENENLQQQLINKNRVERELGAAQREIERLTADLALESERFTFLVDQDHIAKMALWEKLNRTEQELDRLRRASTHSVTKDS